VGDGEGVLVWPWHEAFVVLLEEKYISANKGAK
jgi:hypothetical protein